MTTGLKMVNKAKKGADSKDGEDDSVETQIAKIIQEQRKQIKRIETQLEVKVWAWDKDVGQKLFNFHEGYESMPTFPPLIGSCK